MSLAPTACELAYCRLSDEPFDFLAEILPSMGVSVNVYSPADLSSQRPAVINCLGVSAERVSKILSPGSNHLLVTDVAGTARRQQFGRTMVLPQSYGALRSECLKVIYPTARKAFVQGN